MRTHSAVDVIRAKRDGHELRDDQIHWFLSAYTAGEVADEQASALLMAIFHHGLGPRELATWTDAMIRSGERLDLSAVPFPTVDKHSTGGVGDKISLPLCPLVAACGAAVPQLSGRGLGHTGGTLDKLESIAGFRTALTNEEFVGQLAEIGAAICAASGDLAPADRKLYALRDVTGTVESIPLIASSIMSKKIAEGTDALVLDVKTGEGAFMRDLDDARTLARTMVGIGEANGVRTTALITGMDAPLGLTAGNALEVRESLEVLEGGGPPDVVEVTLALAGEMLALAGIDADPAAALADGRAMDRWRRMVRAQGGDPDAPLPVAPLVEEVRADADGVVAAVAAMPVGVAAWRLGAGRARKEDPVSAGAGVVLRVAPGDTVSRGQVLAELHADDAAHMAAGAEAFAGAVRIGAVAPTPGPRVRERIAAR
ncbi:thymidine phosphorylase [Miltoncostaea oceani]|jgi:thymidine phosphorylase|uniref:thymidine phosphorylase n=1 Tax=Miltoncostaea oceani TaxID=2843216 RepID=UPI001C3E804B|nr:thymidine phosphorylase [Miltoncostaea oceani]